jgi:proteasome lid subunit RPN8/RPN11
MKLKIEKRAWQKIAAYVDNCPYEIGGLGKVTCEGGDFIVSDVEIFTQTVTPAHVDMTAETLAKFQTDKIRAKESMRDYKFWWHSHAKMDAFFSGTDTATIDASGAEFPWLVSFVSNHAHKMIARLDIYQPVHVHCSLEVEVLDDTDPAIVEACKADIAEKVTMPVTPTYGAGFGKAWGGYYGKSYDLPGEKLSKKDKKRVKELEAQLEKKERVLRHLEGIERPTVDQALMLEKTEEAIAEISTELDTLQGLSTSHTITKLPTPQLPYSSHFYD